MFLAIVPALCLAAGLALGLLGGGGSILAVPILVYAGGLDMRAAIPTSLLVVGVSSAVAALALGVRGGERGGVDVRAGLSLGIASMVGAFVGGRLGQHLPSGLLLAAFTAVMVVTAVAMMRRHGDSGGEPPTASSAKTAAVGLAVGLLTGLVGAGGGFVIVPALTLLCGLPMRRAIGTSLFVIAMNSMAGFAGAAGQVDLDLHLATAATMAAAGGSLVGVALSARIAPGTLRHAFAWLLLAMSIFMIAKQLPASVVDRLGAAVPLVASALAGAVVVGATCLVVHFRRSLVVRWRRASPS